MSEQRLLELRALGLGFRLLVLGGARQEGFHACQAAIPFVLLLAGEIIPLDTVRFIVHVGIEESDELGDGILSRDDETSRRLVE